MQIDQGVLKNKKNKDIQYCMTLPNGNGPFPVLEILPGFGDSFLTENYLLQIQARATAHGFATVAMIPSAYDIRDDRVQTGGLTYNNYKNDIMTVDKAVKRHPALRPDKCIVAAASLGANQTLNLMAEGYEGFHAAILYSLVPNLVAEKLRKQITPAMERLWAIKQMTGRGHECLVDTQVREFNYKLYKQAKDLDLFEKAKNVTRPVTIINGTADSLVPIADIERLAGNMTQCRQLSVNFLPGVGHCFPLAPKEGEAISPFDWAFALTRETLDKLAPEATNIEIADQPVFPTLASVQKPFAPKQSFLKKCQLKLEAFAQVHAPDVLVADNVLRRPLHQDLSPM